MLAKWDRTIFYVSAILSGLVTIALISSATTPLPAATPFGKRDRIVAIDSWCMPSACTAISKSVPRRTRLAPLD